MGALEVFANEGFLGNIGGWLSFGTIGLGLALALLSAMIAALKPNTKIYLFSILLSAFIIAFGGGLEFFRAIQKARVDEASLRLQRYFETGAWADLADAISLKFSGSREVTGNAISKMLNVGQPYKYPVNVPVGECRYVVAIAQPPSDIALVAVKNESLSSEMDDRAFYKWLTLCNVGKSNETATYDIEVKNSDGMVRVSTYRDRRAPNVESQTTGDAKRPPVELTACLGEYLGNCPEKPDILSDCSSSWGASVAENECRKRGYEKGQSKFIGRISIGGNKCGYAVADIVCG